MRRTETGELLGRNANVLENLAQSGSGLGAVLYNGLEDVVKQASPCVGGAMDLNGADGGRGEEVLVEL